MSVIVSNTTPINYLVLIDHITVLRHLYARVIIPQAVFGELQAGGTPAKAREWMASRPDWLEVRTVTVSLDAALAFLDVGEREAISLAKELDADALIIDEPDGREAAKRQGLRVIGTLTSPRVLVFWRFLALCWPAEMAYSDFDLSKVR